MITPEQVKEDIRCLRNVRDNVGSILSRGHVTIAKSLIVMHKANPVVAARIAEDVNGKSDAEIAVIEMQTVARLSA